MDASTSHLDELDVGQVFTPVSWAEWIIRRWGVFAAWASGASVCDPTAGEGAFALALFNIAQTSGVEITPGMLSRLFLIEIRSDNLEIFREKARRDYSIEFPSSQLQVRDVISNPLAMQHDILIGNPPWANFADLPSPYKEHLKPYFVAEGLVPDRKKILLGSSRTDIASLVLQVVLGKMVRPGGFGYFYLPLSLFTGDDAHQGFRGYQANERQFAVDEVYEFSTTKIFDRISTSYCCARFKLDSPQTFPVRYFREVGDRWVRHTAVPLKNPDDQWLVFLEGEELARDTTIDVRLSPEQKPRQGVNTCGANSTFIFDEKPIHLPDEYLFPLATKELWKEPVKTPQKWILLPYDCRTGKPLPWHQIDEVKALRDYLNDVKAVVASRKGTLIRSAIEKGCWWSLLGVGPYSFAPYKVIWQAYGRSDFNPIIVNQHDGKAWQGNQAMHAFIPCREEDDAQRIRDALQNPAILTLLKQLNGSGKCNWAQPGKIKKILSFDQPRY